MSVTFAQKCAWRAVYFSRNLGDGYGRHQFFHFGIDPTTQNSNGGPVFFGGLCDPQKRAGRHLTWRIGIPHFGWRYPTSYIYLWFYRMSSKFWHSLDGRYYQEQNEKHLE